MPITESALYRSCMLCPRHCHAARLAGAQGLCGADGRLMVARAALHQWEEPPISGTGGSGTVFFSNCALRCVYCQNREIAEGQAGKDIAPARLVEIFGELQDKGAHNINLVTGTQYAPDIVKAVRAARAQGLTIPIVWNTSGYEDAVCLDMLDGIVDIYLTDFKYFDGEVARAYSSRAFEYPAVAKKALAQMVAQTGPTTLDDEGLMTKGTIVRHLMLPGHLEDSKAIVRYLYETTAMTSA